MGFMETGNVWCLTGNHKSMKNQFLLTVSCVAFATLLFSQSTAPNQFDPSGKRDGKWCVYLDKDWKKTTDSTSALYLRYTWYDHGTNIYPMGSCGGKGYKLATATSGKLLNGEYTWYDAKGRLSSVHVFKDGEYISCREYFVTGELSQHFDYTKKCDGQQYGWTVFCYNKKGDLILTSPTCKDEKGKWPAMRD
jgi:antitoxin component YwqK of YwqJK toxin-antitoxin module